MVAIQLELEKAAEDPEGMPAQAGWSAESPEPAFPSVVGDELRIAYPCGDPGHRAVAKAQDALGENTTGGASW
jgi:hypothetical protein